MNVDARTGPPQSYTILRIKRKRNEEPLDALVVESSVRRKKSRGIGVFQYAQTVEDKAWQDDKSQKEIQEKISRLAKEGVTKLSGKSNIPSADPQQPSSPIRLKKDVAPRYTIVTSEGQGPPTKRQITQPPQVISHKDLVKNNPDFKMYDAILSQKKAQEIDAEMDKFLPLLNDYLKLHDISPGLEAGTSKPANRTRATAEIKDDSDDYVWDVFYHRPTTLSEWNSVAARTGTLIGLSLSMDSDDSSSDSEEDDEADEDSNAEEYYKNDYPEDEMDSEPENSDEFHEDSEYED